MEKYYSKKLSAERLKLCYDLATPRIKQYLDAEINFVLANINPGDSVLELGCGYGRVLKNLTKKAKFVIGIDSSTGSLHYARNNSLIMPSSKLFAMDAAHLGFRDQLFDVVICIQNGLSAFKVNQKILVSEAIRITRPGGKILFSSYSDKFWNDRLEWFKIQSEYGLLGEIDYEKTKNGVIACKDGFIATTISTEDFYKLVPDQNIDIIITEVDESSIFFEIQTL